MDREQRFGVNVEQARRTGFHLPWQPITADYRVVAADFDGRLQLIQLAGSRHEAREAAERAAETVDGEVVSVFTERWIGDLRDGYWAEIPRRHGGYRRTFHGRLRQLARRERLRWEERRRE